MSFDDNAYICVQWSAKPENTSYRAFTLKLLHTASRPSCVALEFGRVQAGHAIDRLDFQKIYQKGAIGLLYEGLRVVVLQHPTLRFLELVRPPQLWRYPRRRTTVLPAPSRNCTLMPPNQTGDSSTLSFSMMIMRSAMMSWAGLHATTWADVTKLHATFVQAFECEDRRKLPPGPAPKLERVVNEGQERQEEPGRDG